MIVALSGSSCTGKTTVARRLRDLLGLPLRSCGEAVGMRATSLGVPWAQLGSDQHRQVDAETREWVWQNRPCLVEGRYLDRVLGPLGGEVVLVRLEASTDERISRQSAKRGLPSTATNFQEEAQAELAFAEQMYGIGERVTPSLVLNTSELSVEACVQRIKSLVEGFGVPPG
jgi:cytidylate kinase